ncbi:unnamed protein product [Camellia sinensis]
MLLRNIDLTAGMCNGVRLICKALKPNVIHAKMATGHYQGNSVLIPRIPLEPAKTDNYPFPFQRKQFPVRSCFAMTINKAQGQTLEQVGIYLLQPVFSHGQLYVALSRAQQSSAVKVLIKPAKQSKHMSNMTQSVVYKDFIKKTSQKAIMIPDSEGWRIQAACFDDDIPMFDGLLHVYKTYYFSNGIIKYIDPRNRIVDNTIQIMLNSQISIEETETTEETNASETYFFIQLADASNYITTNIKFDIATIATNVLPTRTITKRIDGQPAKVREIFLIDQSNQPMKLSAWDDFTTNECEHISSIITEKPTFVATNVRVTTFNGCSLSTTPTTKFIFNANIPEIQSLLGNIWIKGKITAKLITQRPWYVACNKCNCSTMEDIGTSFTCIECNTEQSTATTSSNQGQQW